MNTDTLDALAQALADDLASCPDNPVCPDHDVCMAPDVWLAFSARLRAADAALRAVAEAARPLVAVDPDDDFVPDEDWDPMFLVLRAALDALEATK